MKKPLCLLLLLFTLSLTACTEKETLRPPTTAVPTTEISATTTEGITSATVKKTETPFSTSAAATTTVTTTASTTAKITTTLKTTTTSSVTTATKPMTTQTLNPTKPSVTDPKQAAYAQALELLDESAYSYQGLVNTLKYLGFAEEYATFAADTCGADWNKQAARRAQYHLDGIGYGRKAIIDLLIGEGFTEAQVSYALEANNL